MLAYQVHLITPDHKLGSARTMACVDDEEAMLRAAALKGGFAEVEVWCGHRRVHPAGTPIAGLRDAPILRAAIMAARARPGAAPAVVP